MRGGFLHQLTRPDECGHGSRRLQDGPSCSNDVDTILQLIFRDRSSKHGRFEITRLRLIDGEVGRFEVDDIENGDDNFSRLGERDGSCDVAGESIEEDGTAKARSTEQRSSAVISDHNTNAV